MSMALNKLAGKLESSGPVKVSTPASRNGNPLASTINKTRSYMANPSSLATSSNLKSSVVEDGKQEEVPNKSEQKAGVISQNNQQTEVNKQNEIVPNLNTQTNVTESKDPVIEEETNGPNGQDVDEIITVGAEVNKVEVKKENTIKEEVNNVEVSKEEVNKEAVNKEEVKETSDDLNTLNLIPLDQVAAVVAHLKEDLSDLDENGKAILSRLSSLFQMMKNNQAKGIFKLNLSNKMLTKIVEYKQDAFVDFLINLGFVESNKDAFEASNIDHMKSILNDTDFIASLKQ
jgi:hypothetical protein